MATRDWNTQTIADMPELRQEAAIDVLRSLVSAPSQNGVEIDGERAVADRVIEALSDTPCEITTVTLPDAGPERVSVAAVLTGGRSTPRLVLNGHLDTVPAFEKSLWSVDPFEGVLDNGCLWGRGAVDMKGGLAAQILCARALTALPRGRLGTLVLHFAADEEKGGPGTLSLLNAGFGGDYGIVTEPTRLDIATTMRGMAAYKITIIGRPAHAANVENGLNPLSPLIRVLEVLERYDRDVQTRVVHPMLPPTRCTATMVHAGVEQSSVPDRCEITLDRRLIPGETTETAFDEIQALVDDMATAYPEYRWAVEPLLSFEPCQVSSESPFVQTVALCVEAARGQTPDIYATPYGSDMTCLVHSGGMETIQFGPGDIALAHAPDERTSIVEVQQAAIALTMAALRVLEAN